MSDKQSAPSVPPLTRGGVGNADKNVNQNQQETNVQKKITNVTSNNTPIKLASSKIEQVISASHSTSNQSASVSRIVNSSDPIDVVKVSDTDNSKVTVAPSASQNTKIGLTNSPKLVRTSVSSMILPSDHSSLSKDAADPLVVSSSSTSSLTCQLALSTDSTSTSSPPAKKCKLQEDVDIPIELAEPNILKQAILDYKLQRLCLVLNEYRENATELFFLQNGGNILDYDKWKKELPTVEYSEFMKKYQLGTDSDEKLMQSATGDVGTDNLIPSSSALPVVLTEVTSDVASTSETVTATSSTVSEVVSTMTTSVPVSTVSTPEVSTSGDTPVDVSMTLTSTVAESNQKDEMLTEVKTEDSNLVSNCNPSSDKMPMTNNTDASLPNAIVKLVKLPVSTLATSPPCDTVINNQENIVEKAKQEAYVVQRIAELQREGLWSEKRLPKVQEPPRQKAHWDYLLEEMVWLSADFAQERKWKKSAAKKCARMVQKYFQEKAIQAQKAEKLEELKMKRLASFVAKEIKTFWANVEKLVEYKQQTRLEEKRKKALDQHLNFIVDQTEKYSSWLTEGLNKVEGNLSTPASIHSSRISSPIPVDHHSDDDFKPNQDSDDDEETIAKAEEEMKSNHKEEVELLKKESELTLEDLLKELPPNYLEERDKSLSPLPKNIVEEEKDDNEGKDTEFTIDSDDSSEDEEDTIQEQEKMEQNVDHKQELDDLKAENEMSIDELMAMYGNAGETSLDYNETDNDTDSENEDESKSESDNKSDSDDEAQNDSQSDDEPVGLKSLLEDLSDENKSMTDAKQSEMDSVAAIAESLQPKGNTLLTTSVVTKIPFLLKHTLREYQHIGLDWLVTMFERKLNGILADEMGLGKTIQTIALLGHLACEKGNWGPHLIIVPTSVMLNWEMEFKKWCPGFKILTYYGSQKERKQKRTGWTKPNAFHICITSYKLVIQDHQSFRRKKWKYLILDEAQNIKNFKSQRWQLLLNFQTQRRLLLTGTPLQNNLMELWSLMHFLMPNVFQSHREFKEWFSNPVSGMIEGNNEYNENIIRRLHKVLRPFLLRRLKCEVEKQLPKKYEHVVMCRLSKRQRYLYDDFMSRAKTKETLASGNLLSVINVLMQLRKVCNHPNLFESRPTISPFQMEGIDFHTASLVWSALDYDPFKHIDLSCFNLDLIDLEFTMTAFVAHRIKRLKTPRKLIEEIDSYPPPPPRCPAGKIKINVRLSNQVSKPTANVPPNQQQIKIKSFTGGVLPCTKISSAPLINNSNNSVAPSQGVTLKVASGHHLQGYSVQLVPHQGTVKAIPVTSVAQNIQNAGTAVPTTKDASKITTQAVTVKSGDSVQKLVPGIAQLVQTSTGRHIIITNTNQETPNPYFPIMTSSGQRLTVFPKQLMSLSPTTVSVNKVIGNVVTSSTGRPVMRVSPINVNALSVGQSQPQGAFRCGLITRTIVKDVEKNQSISAPKSEFHLLDLEESRRNKRHNKLVSLANINDKRCAACPVYGEDLCSTLKMNNHEKSSGWNSGWLHCSLAKEPTRTRRQYFSHTKALAEAIKSTEYYVQELKTIFEKFLVHVPAVLASSPKFHVSHPPPHKLWKDQRLVLELKQHLDEKLSILHPIASSMLTQFPDPRLIQYDCGKLQSLDQLLRKLKTNNHRVLIFTQMTRMLDVLEAFLNYHGYIYLRLDGATKIDQRQVLMERFNNDKRIFCFILSTRSGGVGVNLTGADTVVFYDSDWNPTMDAQAQDRCHRIGQTRDVHIYRLISERTIEENILKKANQKRLLGDLAIEGGNFTTAYFKSSTIQDLFNVDQSETDASTRMAEVLEQNKDREKQFQKESTVPEEKLAIGALESALAAVEEDLDVQAARTAKAEAVADLAEFDENIPVDDVDNEDAQVSKAEQEVQNLVSQLTPIERYAMRFVEDSDGHFAAAQLAAAERELEEQKKEWELDRLRALRDEEERQARLAEDDDENLITYSQEDARNQVNNNKNSISRRVAISNSNKKLTKSGRNNRRGRTRQLSRRSSMTRGLVSKNLNLKSDNEDNASSSSDNESDTTSLTETDSQNEDIVSDNSSEDERNFIRVDDEGNDQVKKFPATKKNNLNDRSQPVQNHLDLNSPRTTRSRGDVQINLWTLDVSPLLPESKPRNRKKHVNEEKLNESINTSLTSNADDNKDDDATFIENSVNDSTIIPEMIPTVPEAKAFIKSSSEQIPTSSKSLLETNNETSEFSDKNSQILSINETSIEVQSIDSKKNVTPVAGKVGRPRKQSQSSYPVIKVDSSLSMYSTRSSKISAPKAFIDEKSDNKNKEEFNFDDIDVSNPLIKKIEIHNIQNKALVQTSIDESNIEKSDCTVSSENKCSVDSEKSQNDLYCKELSSSNMQVEYAQTETEKEKVARCYSRIRSELKDDSNLSNAEDDIASCKLIISKAMNRDGEQNNRDNDQKLSITPTKCDNNLTQDESLTPHRISPILNRFSRINRASKRSRSESKEKPILTEIPIEKKIKVESLEKSNFDFNVLPDKIPSMDRESLRTTRSSTRLSETKPAVSDGSSFIVPSEVVKLNDTLVVTDTNSLDDSEKKSLMCKNSATEESKIAPKITRSSTRLANIKPDSSLNEELSDSLSNIEKTATQTIQEIDTSVIKCEKSVNNAGNVLENIKNASTNITEIKNVGSISKACTAKTSTLVDKVISPFKNESDFISVQKITSSCGSDSNSKHSSETPLLVSPSTSNVKIIKQEDEVAEVPSINASKVSDSKPTLVESKSSKNDVQVSMNPPRSTPISLKLGLRRRPDTPMPLSYSVRPVTRSLTNHNNSDSEGSSSVCAQAISSPSSSQTLVKSSPRNSPRTLMIENSFVIPTSPIGVRRSRSTTYIKRSERLAMENKDNTITGINRVRPSVIPAENAIVNRMALKRRPDTPLPSPEQILKIANRSNVQSTLTKTPSPTSSKVKAARRSVDLPKEPSSLDANTNNEDSSSNSNGNSFSSQPVIDSEKPQRTAKVVAMISLDSKSLGKSSSFSSKPKQHNSELSSMNHTKSPKISRNKSEAKQGTITTVTLEDEPDSPNPNKPLKRQRQLSIKAMFAKSSSTPSKDAQTIELTDEDDDDKPAKKLNRSTASLGTPTRPLD
ncbi:helicase domino isoform X1 [Trichogramma pretiosum]|uniref:helicase domino isoform X1 n=1 Tax=Trichogramma pretiosum TaxID=7493 RepID=UPI0006C9AB1C|nr:helicase domino isoform X1 [Trichogramma pretiosum]XP_014224908.1 helicase domino isoform X1 [Trichogramma pretiosum]XP_014224909.1 helicase domino isoform X1 [Trichogramma pretiosum]